MSRAKKIKYIVIHCSAGYGNYDSMKKYWFETLKWNTGGYHRVVYEDGTIINAYDFEKVTNGVQSFNNECIHICYQGGIDKKTGKPLDTRTDAQKQSLLQCIIEAIKWLKANGKDTTKDLMILGHRDFSEDKNNNGKIDSNERIKECPCFDAIPEYKWITYGEGKIFKLPKSK